MQTLQSEEKKYTVVSIEWLKEQIERAFNEGMEYQRIKQSEEQKKYNKLTKGSGNG